MRRQGVEYCEASTGQNETPLAFPPPPQATPEGLRILRGQARPALLRGHAGRHVPHAAAVQMQLPAGHAGAPMQRLGEVMGRGGGAMDT